MPYVITTSQPVTKPVIGGTYLCPMSRRAVGTLDEARVITGDELRQRLHHTHPKILAHLAIPESGGTVGPLPDGTVIEVEPTEWGELVHAGRLDRDADDERLIIDAYNAAQED